MACLLFRGVVGSGGCAERVLCTKACCFNVFSFSFPLFILFCFSLLTFSFGLNKGARYMHVCEANLMISSVIVNCVDHTVLR